MTFSLILSRLNREKCIFPHSLLQNLAEMEKSVYLCSRNNKKGEKTMATAIRAIPTLYGETAKSFESEAKRTEQNPGTQDYRHEAKVVSDFLKSCTAL